MCMLRRHFITKSMAGGAGLLWVPGAFAEALSMTPSQAEGPFFPNKIPLDTDNDLLILNDSINPAIGEVTHLSGKITDAKGIPIKNALIEIWQVDGNGSYIHTGDPKHEKRDSNFQGYGRFVTGLNGEYYFRTIKPVPYPGRVPHIHVKVSKGIQHLLTTQIYVSGFQSNGKDMLFKHLGDKSAMLLSEFKPLQGSETGELTSNFNIVVGVTPEDSH